jgi:hypothetical protein
MTSYLLTYLLTLLTYKLTYLLYFTYKLTYLLALLTYFILITYLLTSYLLNPWIRVLLKKLIGLQLIKKFLAFYGKRRFITAFTSGRHLFLS